MTVFEGRAVWTPKTEASPATWVDLKEVNGRIELSVRPGGLSSREAYLERDQARQLARQLYALARLGDKRDEVAK